MTPYVSDPDFTLYVGDVREVLPKLPAESIDCALTSPPFYALRDYGVEGQIGLEATPDEWAAELVGVFSEVRRVLKPTATLWIEVGESYAGSWGNQGRKPERGTQRAINGPMLTPVLDGRYPDKGSNTGAIPPGTDLKPKDLIGAPWLLAFALRADGWYLRQCIIWHKPNAMPESAKDRCTTAHSYVFLLSKSARYHFDSEAISEPAEWARWGDQTTPKYNGTDTVSGWIQPKTKTELLREQRRGTATYESGGLATGRARLSADGGGKATVAPGLKNPRSVWTIPTEGFAEAHFATWPQALVERIIKAGCPQGGTCLDPFMGSGTTALVARRLGRRSIGIELNQEYAEMAARRLGQQSLLAEAPA